MKTLFYTVTSFLAFTALVSAQDVQDTTQRQPPIITQSQVEKDAKLAQQERKQHEAKKVKGEKKLDDTTVTAVPASTTSSKMTSRPGKQ